MSVDTRVFTADELLRLPDDGSRYELVRGELRKMSPAGLRHGKIARRIATHLGAYADQHELGETYIAEAGFVLKRGPDTVRVPDVSFVRAERVVDATGFMPGPPDLAVEVLSPSDPPSEVENKTAEDLRAGTRAVVVVDPEKRTVRVSRGSGTVMVADILAVDEVVPGWRMPVADIFKA